MIYAYSLMTIAAFALAMQINKKLKSVLLNTFVITILILISIVLICDIPYENYMEGNMPLNSLLGISVVALALPLYEQLEQIKSQWKAILLIVFVASFLSTISGGLIAMWLGANPEMVATILPKSITTPIAMSVSKNIGGMPAVTVASVVIAGLQGSIFGYVLLKKIGVKKAESIGLSVGAVSHALGTVSCMEIDTKTGSFSSIALVLCGVISAIITPFIFKLLYLF